MGSEMCIRDSKLADISTGLKSAMKGVDMSEIPEEERMQNRGW